MTVAVLPDLDLETFLRRSIGLAVRSREAGNHPFAALLVSPEPCAMCDGSVYWAGVGRVVYGMSEKALKALSGPHPENLTLDLPCRDIFDAGQRPVEVIRPLLPEESAIVQKDFGNPGQPTPIA